MLLAIVLIALTIPRVAYEAGRNAQNIRRLEGVVLEREKEEAYEFIKYHTPKDARFLVDNFRGHWYDTEAPTVSVLTERYTYYSGRGILTNLRQDTFEREKTSKTILLSPNPVAIAKTLKDSPIDYLLVASTEAILATDAAKFLNPVFNNSKAVIYEVDRDKIAQYLHTATPE